MQECYLQDLTATPSFLEEGGEIIGAPVVGLLRTCCLSITRFSLFLQMGILLLHLHLFPPLRNRHGQSGATHLSTLEAIFLLSFCVLALFPSQTKPFPLTKINVGRVKTDSNIFKVEFM